MKSHGGSPTARRFRDPLLLLGLAASDVWELDGSGAPSTETSVSLPAPEAATPVWGRHLAHYDVQSILFEPGEGAREAARQGNVTTGASAASQCRTADVMPILEDGAEEEEGGMLVLSCSAFRVEAGGEVERGLGQHRGLPVGSHCPNMAVSVLEEPRESYGQRSSRVMHAIEYADLGACYYRKHFYGKEHQNFFGVDDQLGAVAISLRREEKEGSAGPQYNYRLIIRTSQKQGSEEDMYNNEKAGPTFEEFLNLLGERVRLLGFDKYRAQLDNKILSEAGESLEDEWDSIANLASTCNNILEALSREGQHILENREGSTGTQRCASQPQAIDESQHALSLADKVLYLEFKLKELQDDLQKLGNSGS
ncbi:hypothetical protein E2320_013905 [Naja naja]|nr:hypothetical protein E2320_013905 [Naja naja]